MNNMAHSTTDNSASNPFLNNIAHAEIADFVRNDSMIRAFEPLANTSASSAQEQAKREELWPFTVKVVSTPEQLAKAVKLRHDAYAKHLPEFAAKLAEPEEADKTDIVLLVESKFDGSALGTMRIRTNDFSPLQIENVVDMPVEMQGKRLAEATRLAIKGSGNNRMVRDALFKAFFTVCLQSEVDYMVIAARSPVDRIYEWLDFEDIHAKGEFINLPYAANLPHRVMVSNIETIEGRWKAMNHPLCEFIWDTIHLDISVNIDNRRNTRFGTLNSLRFA